MQGKEVAGYRKRILRQQGNSTRSQLFVQRKLGTNSLKTMSAKEPVKVQRRLSEKRMRVLWGSLSRGKQAYFENLRPIYKQTLTTF